MIIQPGVHSVAAMGAQRPPGQHVGRFWAICQMQRGCRVWTGYAPAGRSPLQDHSPEGRYDQGVPAGT